MKVTLVGAFPPQKKGEAHYLGRYASALRETGQVSIDVVSQYSDYPGEQESDGFVVRRAIRDRSISGVSYASQSELVKAVVATNCDVMHLHYGPGPDYGGRLGEKLCDALAAIRRAGIRTVLTLHSVWLPRDVKEQAASLGTPRALHPIVVAYFGRFMRKLRRSLDAELLLVSAEDSPMTREFSRAYGVAGLSEEVHGCEPRVLPLQFREDDPEILAFGFLRPDKGFEQLIEAFSRYALSGGRGRLKIVGSAQSAQYDAYARKLVSLGKEVANGHCSVESRYVPDTELESLLSDADVLVVPYLRNVGASGPLHHAISFGKPVICSDAGHNAALTGALSVVRAGDVRSLQSAIERVLTDRIYRESLAQNAATMAAERSWRRLAEKNLALYRKLLNR